MNKKQHVFCESKSCNYTECSHNRRHAVARSRTVVFEDMEIRCPVAIGLTDKMQHVHLYESKVA